MKMKIKQVRSYYENRENDPCSLTEELIKAGYQQPSNGYISFAEEQGVEIDYRKAEPTQYWHLMAHCDAKNESDSFGKNVTCGELIFWMAEVANCVEKSKMKKLLAEIIASGESKDESNDTTPNVKYKYKRGIWNKKIQDLCFESINKAVTQTDSTSNL